MKRSLPIAAALAVACAHAPAGAPPASTGATAAATGAAAPGALPPGAASSANALSGGALQPIRASVDGLLRAQGEATWRGWTGGTPPDLASAWTGHERLLEPATLAEVTAALSSASGPERSRLARLQAFLLGEQVTRAAAEQVQALATARSSASFSWEKRPVALRQLNPLLAAEPEVPRRRALREAWLKAALSLQPQLEARDAALARAGAERGFPTSLALAGALRGEDPERLAALAEATLAATDATWRALLDALGRRELNLPASRLREQDLPRLLRSTVGDAAFPADRLEPDLRATLAGFGLDLAAGGRLTVDGVARTGKIPRPLAVGIEVPGEVRLSFVPSPGLEGARALLHEAGVAEALVAVAPGAPVEDRRLPPAAALEAWGLLLEGIAATPEWLSARGLEPEAVKREVRVAAARRLHAVRVAALRVVTEVARATDPVAAAAAWPETAARAFGHPLDRGDPPAWRYDPDPLLRAADTLRAQLLAAQVEEHLDAAPAGSPAPRWWQSGRSSAWLRAAWLDGGARSLEDLARAAGGEPLSPAPLDRVIRAAASAGGLALPAAAPPPAAPPPAAPPAPAPPAAPSSTETK